MPPNASDRPDRRMSCSCPLESEDTKTFLQTLVIQFCVWTVGTAANLETGPAHANCLEKVRSKQVVLNFGLGIKTAQHPFLQLRCRFIGHHADIKKIQNAHKGFHARQRMPRSKMYSTFESCVFFASFCCPPVFHSPRCETNITYPFNNYNTCSCIKALHAPSASNIFFLEQFLHGIGRFRLAMLRTANTDAALQQQQAGCGAVQRN